MLTLALLLVTVSVAGAGGNANPGILPPNSRVQGLTYGEWAASWWQSVLSISESENPAAGAPWTDCFLERIENVGLGIAFFAQSGTFACEMPPGMMLFQPIVGAECSTLEEPPYYGGSEEELRACAMSFVPSELQATIDGVPVQNLSDYLVTSPIFDFAVPEDNVLGVPAGSGQSVAYGAYLMLAPLSPGQHTFHLQGAYPDGWTYDWYYDITVTH